MTKYEARVLKTRRDLQGYLNSVRLLDQLDAHISDWDFNNPKDHLVEVEYYKSGERHWYGVNELAGILIDKGCE